MSVKTYRAKTMQQALALVRGELGPQAAVLRTREVRGDGLLGWIGARQIEVVASSSLAVPSRLPPRRTARTTADAPPPATARRATWTFTDANPSAGPCSRVSDSSNLALAESVRQPTRKGPPPGADALSKLRGELIAAEVSEELARELIDRIPQRSPSHAACGVTQLKHRLAQMLAEEIPVAGPIRPTAGRRHLVALVGPTGVGKTTTIAKLVANYRLRDKRRVGLITVDTYRIAAAEQLRTYADILELPMEIVASPHEMHQALARMAHLDLVLMDTAGRSPRDELKTEELKSMLAEASPDEVHLVLSSVASAASLLKTAEHFAAAGGSALILTKLDEAAALGNLLPLVRASRLPLSYLTHGQNVPDDIAPADAGRLARLILGLESVTRK